MARIFARIEDAEKCRRAGGELKFRAQCTPKTETPHPVADLHEEGGESVSQRCGVL
jgi:hypothetical protein